MKIRSEIRPDSFRWTRPQPSAEKSSPNKRVVWIDIDNSPHVPFFLPIIEELRNRDIQLVLTARDTYQVCDLIDYFSLPCKVVGRHYGKNKLLKVLGNCVRAAELLPIAIAKRPDLAISHWSRSQVLVSKSLAIPTLVMHDYEHSTKTWFVEPDWILMPDVIPPRAMSKKGDRVLRYHGLKEDVYVPGFCPDPSILRQLGLSATNLIVTLRPPATEAHYHSQEGDVLFDDAVRFLSRQPDVRVVVLPRSEKQKQEIRNNFRELICSQRVIIPEQAIDGLNMIWFSDLVISGGGTMNREAAALGVPVYSIFRGKIGAVDEYLAKTGRLVLIENGNDLRTKLPLTRWRRPERPTDASNNVLESIVESVVSILECGQPTPLIQPS